MAVFRDWIPAGEELSGQGRGFADFVPVPEPVKHPEAEMVKEEVKVEEPVIEAESKLDDILNPKKRGKK